MKEAIVNTPRSITDEAAKIIAAKGGVIGIQFGNGFNNPKYHDWLESHKERSQLAGRRGVASWLEWMAGGA